MFGPEPQDIADSVFHTIHDRKMAHSAEDLCGRILESHGIKLIYPPGCQAWFYSGILDEKPDIDLMALNGYSGDSNGFANFICRRRCHFHRRRYLSLHRAAYAYRILTGDIKNFALPHEFMEDPITKEYYLVGVVSSKGELRANDLNRIHED